jgi:peptidoglycan/LPS O-acetylase OafA/YrhL
MTSPEAPPSHSAEGERRSSRFRGDVEGLRAVAVGLVLLYHAGVPFIRGGFVGVDVFFVISGFLITTQLVSEMDRTGSVSLVRFYARRAKRLLPAAGVVLVVTALLTWWFIPETRWKEIGGDIVGSALYVVNWRLAGRSVDYLAEDSQPSPVQHFWSLAVEEQFYLVWPLLILLAILAAKMIRNRTRPALWTGLLLVIVPSFTWSLLETAQTPASAFFETTTRMWELGVGAAVALAAGACARLPRVAAVVIGWAGLVAIAVAGLLFTEDIAWPGYAAALPVIGAAAVIGAGFAVTRGGPASLLGVKPLRWIGGLSYSLYLWHWPLIVVATVYFDGLSPSMGLAVVAVSIVPAWLTFRTVESTLRHSAVISRSARLALSLGANFTLVGVAAGLVLVLAVAAVPAVGAGGKTALGAAVLRADPRGDPAGAVVDHVDWMTPDPTQATKDIESTYADKCVQGDGKTAVLTCRYGDPKGRITLAVIGDSKISQWMSALRPLAEQNGWRLVTYLKSACSFSMAEIEIDGPACRTWTAGVLARLKADPPDYVVTSQVNTEGRDASGKFTEAAMVAGLRSIWTRVRSMGSKVMVIANNPKPPVNAYECVAQHPDKLSLCSFDRKRYDTSSAVTLHTAAKGMKGVEIVDLFDAICPTERCPAVIGNVLIYRQGSHITATYIKSLTPRLAKALTKAHLHATYRKEA